jgi:hypothetical protein
MCRRRVCTVFSVTNIAEAICRFGYPCAIRSATQRSALVSPSTGARQEILAWGYAFYASLACASTVMDAERNHGTPTVPSPREQQQISAQGTTARSVPQYGS